MVNLDSQTESGLIVLSQSYDQGWQTYDINQEFCNNAKLKCLIPWIFNTELEQVMVNGWANGWLVPEGEHQLVIIFWPQYLEYLGFFFLIAPVVAALLATGYKRVRAVWHHRADNRFPYY
jgi:hypothetical protein